MGYSPWVCKQSDTTKRLTLSLSFVLLIHMVLVERGLCVTNTVLLFSSACRVDT